VPVPTGWAGQGGMRLAALFGSSTLWQMARSRGEAGRYEEVISGPDLAAFYAVVGAMAESNADAFVIPNGQPGQHIRPPRDLPGWKASLGVLVHVGLLAESRHRDRVEYRLGPNAERIIQAAADGRSIPFARIEDHESIPVS
jgi:hypothetical protein